jgi:hypothetical protein
MEHLGQVVELIQQQEMELVFQAADQSTLIAVGNNLNGPITNVVNSYDGSTWSAETVYPASIASTWGFGPKTASLFFGGGTGIFGGSPFPTATNSYNGSAWTAGGALPSGRAGQYAGDRNSSTAGLSIGANASIWHQLMQQTCRIMDGCLLGQEVEQ